jgi:hypothetical protein
MNVQTSIRFWNAPSRDVAVNWASESSLRIATSPGHTQIAVLLRGVYCPRRVEALEGRVKFSCRANNEVLVQMDESASLVEVTGLLPNTVYF